MHAAVQCEPWFGSQYIEEDIPSSLIESWRNPVRLDADLHLPRKNEFIPGDFTLRNANSPRCSSEDNPRCIVDEPFIKLWYKMDMTFNVPRANAYFLISVRDGYSVFLFLRPQNDFSQAPFSSQNFSYSTRHIKSFDTCMKY